MNLVELRESTWGMKTQEERCRQSLKTEASNQWGLLQLDLLRMQEWSERVQLQSLQVWLARTASSQCSSSSCIMRRCVCSGPKLYNAPMQ